MNILTDMPIDTTNLAYMRFIECQNNIDERLKKLESKMEKDEKDKIISKRIKEAVDSNEKESNQAIALSLALFMFAASLIASIFVSFVSSWSYLTEVYFMGYDLRTYSYIFLVALGIGILLSSNWMLKNFIDLYSNYKPVSATLYEDGTSLVILDKRE